VTLIVAPNGKVMSKHEGEVDPASLGRVLKTSLVAGGRVVPTMTAPAVRMGKRPPNFIFEPVPGAEMTLRKTAGRPVTLIFWRSSSAKSVEAVRNSRRSSSNGAGDLILAINDGDSVETAKRVAAENKFSATLVTDPERTISTAYGVSAWPTIISVDALGVARTIRHGLAGDTDDEATVEQTLQGSKAQ
jgi:peroxiredoxin